MGNGRGLWTGTLVTLGAAVIALGAGGCATKTGAGETRQRATPVLGAASERAPIHVPIDVANNHVYVKVAAGDRTLDFILDTGAGATSMDLRTARQLGLELGRGFEARGAGAGSIQGAQVRNASVTLVGTDITQPVVSALDLSRLPRREAHRMDGILGYDFINRWVVAIDYVAQELRLYDRGSFNYSGTGQSIPVSFASLHPVVDAAVVLADGDTVRGRFVVDVGAALALALTKPFVQTNRLQNRVGTTIRRTSGGGVGGPAAAEFGRVKALRLGGAEVGNVVVQLFGDSAGVFSGNPDWVGNVGGEVLRRFTVYLDYARRRIILEPHAGTSEPFEADMSGIAFIGSDDLTTFTVDQLVPTMPGGEAGLVVGDTLVAVDGKPVTPRTITELRKRFRREGETVELTVRRAGETRVVVVRARRVI
jgi:predicted aspartyl protease